jgi:hypothetical protein
MGDPYGSLSAQVGIKPSRRPDDFRQEAVTLEARFDHAAIK